MEIQDVFKQLLEARVAHLGWVARAEALVEGLPLDKEQVPLLATNCDFGHWYLGGGRALRHLPAYDRVAPPHERLHHIYSDIFSILYSEEERFNILQWLGIQRRMNQPNRDKARALLPKLKLASQEVLESLSHLTFELNQYIKRKNIQKNTPLSDLEKLYNDLENMGYTGK
ncbi:MAG: CZB domain-containing protein [Mariprofundaceae bacterium]|nr:CZB domain-containing protein [Mariprofundaceae bacterium]